MHILRTSTVDPALSLPLLDAWAGGDGEAAGLLAGGGLGDGAAGGAGAGGAEAAGPGAACSEGIILRKSLERKFLIQKT